MMTSVGVSCLILLFDSTSFITPDGSIVRIQFTFIQILLQLVMFYKHPVSMFQCTQAAHLFQNTIPDAVLMQFDLMMMSTVLLETCTGLFLSLHHVFCSLIKPLNTELNPICQLLALLGAHHFLHVSSVRVK